MAAETPSILPLFHFFNRLRANEFALGTGEYQQFLVALGKTMGLDPVRYKILLDTIQKQKSTGNESLVYPRESILVLCKLLWLKPDQSIQLFEDLFEESYTLDFPEREKETIPAISDTQHNTTHTDPQSRTIVEGPDKEEQKQVTEEKPDPDNYELNEEEVNSINEIISLRLGISEHTPESNAGIDGGKETPLEKSRFVFVRNYFPLDKRKTQQNLRQFPSFKVAQHSMEIDIDATINKTISKGIFNGVVFKKHKFNATFLLLLIDHQGSMVAFEQLADTIRAEVEDLLQPDNATVATLKTCYFYNVASEYLYDNKTHTRYEKLDRILAGMKNKFANIIIISDAGAAKNYINTKRVTATKTMLSRLYKCTSKVAWLNPMPRERWENTSAAAIEESVAMYEANESGIKNAVQLLKGNSNKMIRMV